MQSCTSPDGNDSAVDFSYFTKLLLYVQAMESLIDADSGSESFSSDDETSGKSKVSIRSEVSKPAFNITECENTCCVSHICSVHKGGVNKTCTTWP